MRNYIENWLHTNNFSQKPQLLSKHNNASQPFFTLQGESEQPGGGDDYEKPVSIKIETFVSKGIRNKIKQFANIVEDNYDLQYVDDRGKPALLFASGKLITYLEREEQLPEFLKSYMTIAKFSHINSLPMKYNFSLDITGGGGVVIGGSYIGFTMDMEREGYFLLFNVTSSGHCNIIYPYSAKETEKTSSLNMPQSIEVVPPWGTDLFIGIAFTERPPFWDNILTMAKDARQSDALLPLVLRAVKSSIFAAGRVLYCESRPKSDLQ